MPHALPFNNPKPDWLCFVVLVAMPTLDGNMLHCDSTQSQNGRGAARVVFGGM